MQDCWLSERHEHVYHFLRVFECMSHNKLNLIKERTKTRTLLTTTLWNCVDCLTLNRNVHTTQNSYISSTTLNFPQPSIKSPHLITYLTKKIYCNFDNLMKNRLLSAMLIRTWMNLLSIPLHSKHKLNKCVIRQRTLTINFTSAESHHKHTGDISANVSSHLTRLTYTLVFSFTRNHNSVCRFSLDSGFIVNLNAVFLVFNTKTNIFELSVCTSEGYL